MIDEMKSFDKTQNNLIEYFKTYTKTEAEDVFKYIFQSVYGCEHMVSDKECVLDLIMREYEGVSKSFPALIEPLDGDYSRVHLSCLNSGLKPETLAELFCLSAEKRPNAKALLEEKIKIAAALVKDGILPFDVEDFTQKLNTWRAMGYPPLHHSATFRAEYHPAYRVIANRYVELIESLLKD